MSSRKNGEKASTKKFLKHRNKVFYKKDSLGGDTSNLLPMNLGVFMQ